MVGTLGDMGRGSAATARRRDGFVVLPRHLAGPEREVARAGLAAMYLQPKTLTLIQRAGATVSKPAPSRPFSSKGRRVGGHAICLVPSPNPPAGLGKPIEREKETRATIP